MIDPKQIHDALREVRDQESFIQRLLVETLEWRIDENATAVDDIGYPYHTKELEITELDEKLKDSQIRQIVLPNNPWGIFVLDFTDEAPLTTGRGMTGVLRTVLSKLIERKRGGKNPSLPSFQRDNLLFICNHEYQHYRFARFKAPKGKTTTSPMASFGWGPDDLDALRTICEFNLLPLAWPKALPKTEQGWVDAWSAAFDVDKVTKRFYDEYKRVFGELEAALDGPESDEDKRLTAQTLMNRLMFLRFVERKGWLKFNGGGPYLRNLSEADGVEGQSLYKSRLEPLFFDALGSAERNGSKATKSRVGEVPFLGGGLFERSPLDESLRDVPDAPLQQVIGPAGLFYRFNFTVEESTPLDVEVAVDPEMLGKVFEELVTGRHESGSYYTPRPIVSFMCREALKGYLVDKAGLTPEVAAAYVDDGDVGGIEQKQAPGIIAALDNLKAVDPACGSGAYLLGLLHELLRLYSLVYSEKLKRDAKSLYELKLQIISHNLYGVDIDPFATNIAMLRLWLSLVVEADDPVPLPNLDFKIETGDSVQGPDPQVLPGVMFSDTLTDRADKLIELKEQYLSAQGAKSKHLRAAIEREQAEINERQHEMLGEGVCNWRVQFAEVFVKNHGFDIVLANPPYIRQEKIKAIKPRLKEIFGTHYLGTADLYVYFYLRGLQLLRPGGMLVFISSNKWFRAGYGKKLRSHMAKTTSVQTILDFHDLPVFESAIAYPMIFIAAKTLPAESTAPVLVEPPSLDPPYPDVLAVVGKYGHRLPTTAIGTDGGWRLASDTAADLLEKMRCAGPTLGQFIGNRVFRGLTTGLNKAFVVDGDTRRSLIEANPESEEIIKPFAAGRDITRWHLRNTNRWIIVTEIGVNMERYPAVMAHLQPFEDALAARADQGDEWWELRSCTYYEEFRKPKIVSTKVSISPTFALDREAHYLGNTSYFLPAIDDNMFLLGVLNSEPSRFYAQNVFVGKQNGWYEVQPAALEGMPIPSASSVDRAVIAALAEMCVDAEGNDCDVWQREIDERVAALYGIDIEVLAPPGSGNPAVKSQSAHDLE